jgi:hypothetical protein
MVARKCWDCQFFIADNAATVKTGICVRKAPTGADFSAFALANAYSYRLEMGHCLAAGTMVGDAVIPLHIDGNADSMPPSCHATDATGMNADDILPFSLPEGAYFAVKFHLAASRLNTGAATVGLNPKLKLVPVRVNGDDQGASSVIELILSASSCQPHGTGTDLFSSQNITLGLENYLISGLVGFRVDLSGTSEDYISQVRNLKIGIEMALVVGNNSITPPTSKAKFAAITDGSIQYCGDFKRTTETIPAIPA